MIKIEEQQEINLRSNWELRKDPAKIIATEGLLTIFKYEEKNGRVVFYITRGNHPLGYIACRRNLDEVRIFIASTYLTPVARNRGHMTFAYRSIMHAGFILVSDYDRSIGGEALWQKLMRDPTLSICNYDTNQYIGVVK